MEKGWISREDYWRLLKPARRPSERDSARDHAFALKREEWLRNHHKQALLKRALSVLGEDARELLSKFRKAYKANPEQLDYHVRSILRHCAKLPDGKRRVAYFRTCITRLINPDDEQEAHTDPLEELKKRIGDDSACAFFNQLYDLFRDDLENDEGKLCRIMNSALEKRYPARWLRVVVANARREQNSKRRRKLSIKAHGRISQG